MSGIVQILFMFYPNVIQRNTFILPKSYVATTSAISCGVEKTRPMLVLNRLELTGCGTCRFCIL